MINDVVGKLIADKYRIGSLIREVEAGDLYVGQHEILDKPVTVKVLSSAFAVDQRWVKRFVAEARAASAVSHPNILNITDFGTDAKNMSYSVFESSDGITLRDTAAAGQPLDEKRALDIARQIAAAVVAAHGKKIIHASLTPENVFVNEGDAVKVYGFGGDPMNVARDADPRYLAPEQCNAFPAADERSDVYALGVILYEMLGGAVPYDGRTAADILAKQNIEPPAPLSSFGRDLHPEIEPIVLSAMALDPERRYPNMAAFAEDLEILAGRLGVAGAAAPEVAAAAAAGSGSKRNIWQTAVFVFAGIAIFAAALIYATSVRKTDPTQTMQAEVGSLPVQPIGSATGAQEEALARMPIMTEAEIMAASAQTGIPGDDGFGDGYNAWANGGMPRPGAPLTGPMTGLDGIPTAPPIPYTPQGGEVYTIQQGGQSPFMPDYNPGGVELRCKDVQTGQEIPCPTGPPVTARPSPTPKTPAANTAVAQPTPEGAPTPKPMATPPPKNPKPATDQPGKGKPAPAKPTKSGTEKISEELSEQ